MPRKKTVQPQPIEVQKYGDLIVEVYADDKRPIGRGMHKKHAFWDRHTRAMERLAELHLSAKPSDHRLLDDYLENSSELAQWLELTEKSEGGTRTFWRTAKAAILMFKALEPRMKKRGQP